MNKEIELHDSTLSEIKIVEDKIILIFDTAIVHHSNGIPGIDDGTCWKQRIEIIFSKATINSKPDEVPNEIVDGCLTINNEEYRNMFKTSLKAAGEIDFNLLTAYNKNLHIEAQNVEVREIGEPIYLTEFIHTE